MYLRPLFSAAVAYGTAR